MKRKKSGNVKKHVEPTVIRKMCTNTFVPLQDALGVDWTSEDQKKTNQLSSQYFLMRGKYCYIKYFTLYFMYDKIFIL